jgi:hypothetical protein
MEYGSLTRWRSKCSLHRRQAMTTSRGIVMGHNKCSHADRSFANCTIRKDPGLEA